MLALRADGGPGRGVGHLARSLALGEAWVGLGGSCALVSTSVPPPWDDRFVAGKIPILGSADELEAKPTWWVVDGYELDGSDAPAGSRVARIDDGGRSPIAVAAPPEVVLDQNLGATAADYQDLDADILLGTRYALLRRSLVAASSTRRLDRRRPLDGATRVLIAMGGSPTLGVRTYFDRVAAGLRDEGAEVMVLGGGDDPVPDYLVADIAVAASGSTCWELAAFAIPAVLVAVAPNQVPLAREMAAAGAALGLGSIDAVPPSDVVAAVGSIASDGDLRAGLSREIARLVDGRGAARVATRLRSSLLELRPAAPEDVGIVHTLNDDPVTRANSWSTDPIPWTDHEHWYASQLADPARHLYLATAPAGDLVGLVRFHVEDRVATISVVVEPNQRGRGWGAALIDAGVRRLHVDLDRAPGATVVERVTAEVKPVNEASSRAFLDADFDREPTSDVQVIRYARRHGPRTDR